ncbi:MAG: FAD-dependent thymidylate synthase [Desulfurococcaceae archaeon]
MFSGCAPFVKLVYWVGDAERFVASAAKATLSPRSFEDLAAGVEPEAVEKWIQELIVRGHGSPLEHSLYIFEVVCSRVCSHQLVRHRHASYSQLSQRYSDKYLRQLVAKACRYLGCEHKEDPGYIANVLSKLVASPIGFNELLDIVCEAYVVPPVVLEKKEKGFLLHLVEATRWYYEQLARGVSYEDARYLLPQAVKTRIVVSMNARELVEVFLPLRMCTRAQWEIRAIAWSLWRQLSSVHPAVFKYTGPRCVLAENRVRQTPCTLDEFLRGECAFTIERCPEKTPRGQLHKCLHSAKSTLGDQV